MADVLTSVKVGAQRQGVILRRLPDYYSFIAMSPFSTVMFVAIVRSVGRDDLGINALIGVSIITAWQTGLFVASDTLASDRQMGLLELGLAAPVSLRATMLGRLLIAATYALIPFVISLVAARLVFGSGVVSIDDPAAFVLVLAATWFALLGAFMIMSPVAILSGRSTALFNGLSYPLFLIGGIFVPVTFLPDWIQPVSSVVFMRWTAEGMRAAAGGDGSVGSSVLWILVCGAVMLAIGARLLTVVVDRMRNSGKIIDS